ncbi:lymphocyte antigen 6D-like isoform X3 [Eriocheir sinensis]|uniref:lymphocyte antigen 6D-like isoform X3 n=1 Tax=Eriocheir sinensis TaxID=95602 RepID=UPI0021CA4C44|nr:lymphocyte antigen 6D-like isoform X3 [Eriocheir sinensis]
MGGVQAAAWWRVAAVVVVVAAAAGGAGALRCYKCNNCIKYELSQSQTCDAKHTHCMKMHMETGQVQRSCGTEEMCTNSETELKTRYTDVSCCTEDNCNSAPSHLHMPVLPQLLLALLLPAARFFLHFY